MRASLGVALRRGGVPALIALVLATSACNRMDGKQASATSTSSVVLTDEGGNIRVGGVSLNVLPGSAPAGTVITAQWLNADACRPVVAFGPDGLRFDPPATLALEGPANCAGPRAVLTWSHVTDGYAHRLPTTRSDDRITSEVHHFSSYAVVADRILPTRVFGHEVAHNGVTASVDGPDALLELSGDGDRAVLRRITTAPSPVTVTWQGLNPDRAMYWRVIGEAAQRGGLNPGGGMGAIAVTAMEDAVTLVSATQGTIVVGPGQLASLCGTAALPGTYGGTTCTLSGNAVETVELDDPGQTLDCAGHEILGGNYDNQGLSVGPRATGATVKRCTIRYGIGIHVFAEQVRLEQNNILSALGPGSVGIQSYSARQLAVRENHIADAVFPLIVFGPQGGPVADITGNTIINGYWGVFFGDNGFAATGTVPSWEVIEARIGGNTIAGSAYGLELQVVSAPPTGQSPVRVEGNTLTGLGMRINWLGTGPGPSILHNNVHGVLASWDGNGIPVPFEASFGGEGNYWGRTSLPLFVPGVDSNDVAVVDSHAYCAENGWNTGYSPGACSPVVAPEAPSVQFPNSDTCYSLAVYTISGVLAAPLTGTVRVYDSGFLVGEGSVSGSNFGVTLDEPFGEGSHVLTATVTSLGQESAPSPPVSFFVDQRAPATPVVFTAGPHATLPVIEFSGSAEAGSYILAWLDSAARPTVAAAQVDASGLFGPALVGPVANGAHTLHVQVADCAMNLSPEVQRAVLLQYVPPPPPPPVIESPACGTTHAIVTSLAVRIAEQGIITITDNNTAVPSGGATLPAGLHSIPFPAPLLPGAHILRAWLVRSTDGSLSDSSAPVAFRVDPTPPPPVITDPAPGSIHATPVPRVRGTTTGTGLTLFDGATPVAETAVIGGRFDVLLASPMGKGIHTLEAIAHVETPLGRMFSAPTYVKFSVFPNELDAPVVMQPVAGQTTLAPLVAVSGISAPGATLVIALDGAVKKSLKVQPDGRWAGVLSDVAPGTHRMTASASLQNMGSPTTSPVDFTVVAPPDPAQVIEDSSGRVGFSVTSIGQRAIDIVDQQKSTTVYAVKFRAMPANTLQRRAFTVMRERYRDLDTGEVYANVAAVHEHGAVANAQEGNDAIMAYDGRADTGGYPFEIRRLRRESWVETAYVTNTPSASCTPLSAVQDLTKAFSEIDFTQLKRPDKGLSYCVVKQSPFVDLGDVVLVIGVAESPEGWLSQLKRTSADLQRFANHWGWDLNAPLPTGTFPPDPLPQVGHGRPQAQLNVVVEPAVTLVDLRSVRTFARRFDQRMCRRQTPAVHCDLDLRACGVPEGCTLDFNCASEPDVEVVDWTDCASETCEEAPELQWQCHCGDFHCSCDWVWVMVRLDWTCHPSDCRVIGTVPGAWVCSATCTQGAPPGECGTCDVQLPELECAEPRPVETGYNPVAPPDDGNERIQLARAADDWEEFTERHIIDGQYLGGEIDPRLGENQGFFKMTRYHDRRNATGVTAEVAAARAYKYGVTHSAQDREELRQSLVAVHAMMTVANDPITWSGGGADQHAPDGSVIDPYNAACNVTRETRDGGVVTTQVGRATFVKHDHCDNDEGSPTAALLPDGTVRRFADGGPVVFDPRDNTDVGATTAGCVYDGGVRRGVWPRSLVPGWYERELRPEFVWEMFEEGETDPADENGIRVIAETMYGFQGSLPEFNTLQSSPSHPEINRYRFVLRASRDIVDTMMFAVSAARAALGPNDDLDGWMTDVAGAVGDFMMALIDHGYTMIDIDGQPTAFGRMLPPVPELESETGDPTHAFEVLAWLRTCARVAPGPVERQRCREEYARVLRQWVILPNQEGGGGFPSYSVAGVLLRFREVLHAGTFGSHHRPFLIALAVQMLLERDASMDAVPEDAIGRDIIAQFWFDFGRRLFSYRRVPFFDTLTVFANEGWDVWLDDFEPRDGQSTRARVGAILRQYPSPRYRPLLQNDLVSPSIFVAPRLAAPACATLQPRAPFCTTPVCQNLNKLSFRGCDHMRNPFVPVLARFGLALPGSPALVPNEHEVDSIWALGQGLAMPLDIADGNRSYMLQEGDTCDDNSRGGVLEPYGYGFLLAYWHAVFHNTVRRPP